MSPLRVDLTMRLAGELGVLDDGSRMVAAPMADDDLIATVHEPGADRGGEARRRRPDGVRTSARGLGTDDNPVFHDMHHAAAHVVGATRRGVPPGLERREPARAPTSPAACTTRCPTGPAASASTTTSRSASSWLLDQGAERVAYVDVDVHHGDGVEQIFWDDPRVLTISLHETGQMLFPGTGFPQRPAARTPRGRAVNVALPPGTVDAGWLRAFHAVVPPLLREFAPEVLVTQHGCDSHIERPARAPDAHRRRPAGGVPRPARPRPRGLPAAAGWRPAAAATPWSRSCRAPGRTCSPIVGGQPARPATRRRRRPGATHVRSALGRTRAAPDDRRPRPGVPRLVGGLRPGRPGWTGRSTPPATEVFPLHGLDPLP